eukprot:11165033-Lingulodinium_polyedra.AAC.1
MTTMRLGCLLKAAMLTTRGPNPTRRGHARCRPRRGATRPGNSRLPRVRNALPTLHGALGVEGKRCLDARCRRTV